MLARRTGLLTTEPRSTVVAFSRRSTRIHECFIAVPDMITKFQFIPQSALSVGTQIHTAPEAFGKVMSRIKPQMAVAYHVFNDFDTSAGINDRIRSTYDGPLSLAVDYMVWNTTKDDIRVRMTVAIRGARPWLVDGKLNVTHLDKRSITLEVRSQESMLVTALNTDDQSARCSIPPGLVPVAGHALAEPWATHLPPRGWGIWSSA